MERYTPNGVRNILNGLYRKEKELKAGMIACHRRKKNEHPRYEKMTDEEFRTYINDTMFELNKRRRENREEIRRFEKML